MTGPGCRCGLLAKSGGCSSSSTIILPCLSSSFSFSSCSNSVLILRSLAPLSLTTCWAAANPAAPRAIPTTTQRNCLLMGTLLTGTISLLGRDAIQMRLHAQIDRAAGDGRAGQQRPFQHIVRQDFRLVAELNDGG